ncbi:MAG: thioesterase family protein [Acidimicrobiia bacterium]|nr:thioesterase family protein [Acidimicrobiia bacterium]
MATDTVDVEALYVREGDRYQPSILAQGPWDPTTQHGGAVCALLAAASETVEPPSPMRPARFTVDLLRPVPLACTTAKVDVVREGTNIQVLDVELSWGVKLVARGTVLRVADDKVNDADDAKNAAAAGPPPPGHHSPDSHSLVEPELQGDWEPPGFVRAVEYRRVEGTRNSGVPATAWSRLVVPVLHDEVDSPFTKLAAIVDFTSGTANYMDFTTHTMPNADVSAHLLRPLVGEWLGIKGACMVERDGVALSEASLWDERGRIGVASATLVVATREPGPA